MADNEPRIDRFEVDADDLLLVEVAPRPEEDGDAIGEVTPGVELAFCPTGEGGGVDPSCSPGGGAPQARVAPYKDLGTKSVKVSEVGTIKLTAPKTPEQARGMLDTMNEIAEVALAEVATVASGDFPAEVKVGVELRMNHIRQQYGRAVKMVSKFIDTTKESLVL